mmetsp:Transcript_27811/g.61445  ORF Transcript_27811/g.61445 Transcript_27811/m.61445 type:complete len:117 (-) Transcript_27811:60-410(-)|eukprot:CAMPEP_0116956570 /NCGR_PEP_ID=MMETSP0467-20121206/43415_1 /TAXON_ID=283647 /ORGANISM="Mesodinium pulex, Strain SPMC105" /LENGTH=116 /DNA_ID=CAMNT_0004643075 /DNA_START=34 /DNA_END=384 /DNA_ORIENTATION=+
MTSKVNKFLAVTKELFVDDEETAQKREQMRSTMARNDKKNFPGQNQAQYCWQKYNEFLHCVKVNGEDESQCAAFELHAKQFCPDEWTSTWSDQREAGVFLGVQTGEIREDLKPQHH